jgi:hypothetical protein
MSVINSLTLLQVNIAVALIAAAIAAAQRAWHVTISKQR